MRMLRSLKRVVSSIDMFYSSEMLRYESDTEYKTITGGMITISIIAVVTIGFASMIADTLNRTAITASLNVQKSNNPTYYDLTADPSSMFMFGVMLQPIDVEFIVDIANGPRYMDISLILYHLKNGGIYNATDVPLVPCTDQHWSVLPEVVTKKDIYQYQKWLCPQLGQVIPLQGSYTSDDQYEASIFVRPCTNTSDMDRPCMPQTAIDELMSTKINFYLSLQYINPVINPTEPNYMSYYLQGNDYVIFSATQGAEAWFFFSDYEITTDNSILPYSQTSDETGVMIEYKAVNHPYTVSDYSGYANLYLAKSSNSLQYTRSVQKISAVFSYIGGLVGALTALLFLLKSYTSTSLQLSMAIDLFHQSIKGSGSQEVVERGKRLSFQKDSEVKQQLSFNIVSFFCLAVYNVLSFFNLARSWEKPQLLNKFKGQILHQLDIKTLLKRMISLENCIGYLFQKHQLQGLKYQRKLDLTKARNLREQLVPPEVDSEDITEITSSQSQTVDYNSEKIANSFKEGFQKGQGSSTLPSNQATLARLTGKFKDVMKDEVVENSAKDCISIDCSRDIDSGQSRRKTVKITTQKEVSCETLQNLQLLRKKAQTDEFSRKIWTDVDDSIKVYIQKVIRQQNEGALKKKISSECSIEPKKENIKFTSIRTISDQ